MFTSQTAPFRKAFRHSALAAVVGALALGGLVGCSAGNGVRPADAQSLCFVAEDTGYLTRTIGADLSAQIQKKAPDADMSYKRVNSVKESVDGRCATVITYGDSLADEAVTAAKENPQINFVIDHAVTDDTQTDDVVEKEELGDNVKPLTVGIDQAATIAGYIAAGTTQSGFVGVITTDESGALASKGFSYGVASYNKAHGTAVEVVDTENKLADMATAPKAVANMKKAKVDTLLLVVGEEKKKVDELKASAKPLADALAEDTEYKPSLIWVGEEGQESYPDLKELTVTSINVNTELLADELIKAVKAGSFNSEPLYGDLRNSVVTIGNFAHFNAWISEELTKEIEELSTKLTDGKYTLQLSDSKADTKKAKDDKAKDDGADAETKSDDKDKE